MVLLLAIGDTCVPYGATDIHPKLKALLKPGKIERILCTGNLCDKATKDFLRSVSSNLTVVQGDLDDTRTSSSFECVDVEDFRIGLCRSRDGGIVPGTWVDVMVVGNHTTEAPCTNDKGQIVIHPGSASGFESHVCSFVLMDVKGDAMVCYWYRVDTTLSDGGSGGSEGVDVTVEKYEFSKAQIL